MVPRVVLPVAGLGTRLLPATKAQPKEALPVFCRGRDGGLCVKPLVQLVFEQLFDVGFREFCFVVGRGKRAIEDHFTPDSGYVSILNNRGKVRLASELEGFYRMLGESRIVWVNQPEPRGFGDAVLRARSFTGRDPFLVHAGDTCIVSDGGDHLSRLLRVYGEGGADAVMISQEMEDPREYGVLVVEDLDGEVFRVVRAVEKPRTPPSNLAIMPIYVFGPVFFEALEATPVGVGSELQVTDAIQTLVDRGLEVRGIRLGPHESRLDVGTPQTYWNALRLSYEHFQEDR